MTFAELAFVIQTGNEGMAADVSPRQSCDCAPANAVGCEESIYG